MIEHSAQGPYDFRPLQGASSHPDFARGLTAIVALVVAAVPTATPDGTVIDHPFGGANDGSLGKHWKPFASAALAQEKFEAHTRALLLSALATAAPRVAESVEEFNKEIERRQKVTAGKAADTAEALKTERIRLEKLEKLNREGSPTLTELQLKELVKKVEERFKYTISTRNIASCFCITKLQDILKNCQLPISPNLLPDGLKPLVDDSGDFIRYDETFTQQRTANGSTVWVSHENVASGVGLASSSAPPKKGARTILVIYIKTQSWLYSIVLASVGVKTPLTIASLRGGGDDFVTPGRVAAFCEKLFFVGWEPGMTIVYFRVLRNTILTSITETVRGEGPGGGASLDYALKEAMIQLDADILDFRKRLAQDKAVSGYDAVMEVILFPFFYILFFLYLFPILYHYS